MGLVDTSLPKECKTLSVIDFFKLFFSLEKTGFVFGNRDDIAGINNIEKRGCHDSFLESDNPPRNLHKYADLPLGKKLDYIDDSWYPIEGGVIDNHLRNSLAHYKAEYDDISQVIAEHIKNMSYEEALELFEKEYIEKALKENQYNVQKTAESIGINERTLYRKINKLGIA